MLNDVPLNLTQTQNLTQTLMKIQKIIKSKCVNEHSLFTLLFSLCCCRCAVRYGRYVT